MKIYIAIVDDHLTGTDATPFYTPEAAIAYACAVAKECSPDGRTSEYSFDAKIDEEVAGELGVDWLYHACYGPEGDCVWVVPKQILHGTPGADI
jgi:hypothetical protein